VSWSIPLIPFCVRILRVRFLGVWDTVGHLGLPKEIRGSDNYDFFRFNDEELGDHIERACQALAVHETRDNFVGRLPIIRNRRPDV
jgi:hypothetical protein